MPEDNKSNPYYSSHDDRAYWIDIQPEPETYNFSPTVAPPVIKKRKRHIFTQEERLRGYENAKLSVDERFPDARCKHGAALSHCLLRVKHPGFDAKAHRNLSAF